MHKALQRGAAAAGDDYGDLVVGTDGAQLWASASTRVAALLARAEANKAGAGSAAQDVDFSDVGRQFREYAELGESSAEAKAAKEAGMTRDVALGHLHQLSARTAFM